MVDLMKRQPQPRDEGCLIEPSILYIPYVTLLAFISLPQGDDVGCSEKWIKPPEDFVSHL